MKHKLAIDMKQLIEVINWGGLIIFCGTMMALLLTWIIYVCPIKNDYITLKNDVEKIKNEISSLSEKNESVPSDYENTLLFLKDEIQQYREFIQQQEQHIIWVGGIVISIFGTGLAFFNYKRKKDIQQSVQEMMNKDIARIIGDNSELEYIRNSVSREKEAHKKRILFVVGESEDYSSFKGVKEHFKNEGFNVESEIQVVNIENYKKRISAKKYDILIFQVPENEKEDKNVERERLLLYTLISKDFKNSGIFYCPNFRIDFEKFDGNNYTTVNYISKLKETLYSLLYYGD